MREPFPDFDNLSAYVDGELDPWRAAEIAARAARDPAVSAEIAKLHAMRAGVAGIGEDAVILRHGGGRVAGRTATPRGGMVIAVAAAFCLAIAVLVLFLPGHSHQQPDDSPAVAAIAVHDRWLEDGGGLMQPADLPSSERTMLLAASGLIEVHRDPAVPLGEFSAAHFGFVGANGCRLSLFEIAVGEGDLQLDAWPPTPDLRVATWRSGAVRFVAVARDMNATRFTVVTDALRDSTLVPDGARGEVVAALKAARQPCLG